MSDMARLMKAPGVAMEGIADWESANEVVMARGWGDGLPVVPPTSDRVEKMLAYCDRPWDEPVAVMPPRNGDVTPLRLAANAITAFGTLPLKIWTLIGSVVSASALIYGLYVVIKTLLFGADVPGFPSLLVAILFFAGVQLIGLGIIGEYIGHVFSEVKRRPLYFVREAIGFDKPPATSVKTPGITVPETLTNGQL